MQVSLLCLDEIKLFTSLEFQAFHYYESRSARVSFGFSLFYSLGCNTPCLRHYHWAILESFEVGRTADRALLTIAFGSCLRENSISAISDIKQSTAADQAEGGALTVE